jgi:hypothetical protein
MNELDPWITAAAAELGLDAAEIPVGLVLDVARDVAHQVLRPGAPVSAYLMGVAVGRGADPSDVADRLSTLALSWPPAPTQTAPTQTAPTQTAPTQTAPTQTAPAQTTPAEGRGDPGRADPHRAGSGRTG